MEASVANAWLASFFGPDRSSVAPDSWDVALFVGDPLAGGVEQDGPGYARKTISSGAFPALASLTDGTTSVLVTFDPADDEWPNDSTYYALFDGEVLGPSAPLGTPVEVGSVGLFPPVLITVFFNDVEEF